MKRPKRIQIGLYWSYTRECQHLHIMNYEPNKMLNGSYRKLVNRLKALFMYDPLYNEERVLNGNKVFTHVKYIF